MCFKIRTPEKTTKSDRVCYKRLRLIRQLGGNVYQSTIRGFHYKPGKVYRRADFGISGGIIINEGFHSYSSKEQALSCIELFGGILVKCIIPKGTRYYYNSDYGYVSLAIKLIGKL